MNSKIWVPEDLEESQIQVLAVWFDPEPHLHPFSFMCFLHEENNGVAMVTRLAESSTNVIASDSAHRVG